MSNELCQPPQVQGRTQTGAPPFAPGRSGNPGGRPAGSLYPREAYRMLSSKTPDEWRAIADGDESKLNGVLMTAARLLVAAFENPGKFLVGDTKHIDKGLLRWWSDFTEQTGGKATQRVEHEHTVTITPEPQAMAEQLARSVLTMTPERRAWLADLIQNPERLLDALDPDTAGRVRVQAAEQQAGGDSGQVHALESAGGDD